MSNTVHEPRVLWSSVEYSTLETTTRRPRTRVVFRERDFLNGEHYPITLRHLLIDAPALFDTFTPFVPGPYTRQSRAAWLANVELSFRVRGVSNFSRFNISPRGVGEVPTDEPRGNGGALGVQTSARLFNAYRWTFTKPMNLPSDAVVDFELGGLLAIDGTQNLPVDYFPTATLALHQKGGGFANGSARTQRVPLIPTDQQRLDFPVDAYSIANNYLGGPAGIPAFPPQSRFNARVFQSQNPNGAGSASVMKGFSVAIDQQLWDAEAALAASVIGQGAIGSVGAILPARARVARGNGGSGAYWWRDGAPLSLVCPTMTTAHVYPLPAPITLEPGQALEVVATMPQPTIFEAEPLDTRYALAVSFAGEARIYG